MRGWGSESQPVGLATQPGPSTSPHSPPRPVGVGKKLGRWQASVLRPWSPLRSKPKQMVGKNSGRNSGVGSRSLRVLLWAPPSDAGPQEQPQDVSGVTRAVEGLTKGSEWKYLLWEHQLPRTSWPGSSDSARAPGSREEQGDSGAFPCK